MRCEDDKELDVDTSVKVVQFMIDNYNEILSVPQDLKEKTQQRIKANTDVEKPKVSSPLIP